MGELDCVADQIIQNLSKARRVCFDGRQVVFQFQFDLQLTGVNLALERMHYFAGKEVQVHFAVFQFQPALLEFGDGNQVLDHAGQVEGIIAHDLEQTGL